MTGTEKFPKGFCYFFYLARERCYNIFYFSCALFETSSFIRTPHIGQTLLQRPKKKIIKNKTHTLST